MRHVDLELLLLVRMGVLEPRVLSCAMYDHLRDICPECRSALDAFGAADGAMFGDARPRLGEKPFPFEDARYAPAFGRIGEKAFEWVQAFEQERRRAREDVETLLILPAVERERRVVRARNRFRSRAVAELLIEECRRLVRASWKEASDLAGLVPIVLSRIPGAESRGWQRELCVRAHAHQANAHRAGGDLKTAERLFAEVRHELAESGSTDAELHAEIASLEASLRLDQQRLDEALRLLDRAHLLAREIQDDALLARTLVQRGTVLWHQGRLDEAGRDEREALALFDPDADAVLYACAVANLALCLNELGRYDEAAAVIVENRDRLAAASGEWSRLRLLWLEGRIAHGRRHVDEAERLLLEARNGFIAQGKVFDVALVSLGVDPVSWTPHPLGEGSPRCRRRDRRTRRSCGRGWSSWCDRVGRRRSCRGSSSRRRSRFATGSSRPTSTRVVERTG